MKYLAGVPPFRRFSALFLPLRRGPVQNAPVGSINVNLTYVRLGVTTEGASPARDSSLCPGSAL